MEELILVTLDFELWQWVRAISVMFDKKIVYKLKPTGQTLMQFYAI